MKRAHWTLALLVLCLGISAAPGCQSMRSPSYYVLVSVPPTPPAAPPTAPGALVVVDPIIVPGYLDRRPLVSRPSPGELSFSRDDRWSEDLSENASRVLADNLALRIPSDRVGVLQPGSPQQDGTRLRVEISRFERSADGDVELIARWSLRRQSEPQPHLTRRSTFRVKAEGTNAPATVRAMSQALAALADEIRDSLAP